MQPGLMSGCKKIFYKFYVEEFIMKVKLIFVVLYVLINSLTIAQVPQMVEGWPYLTRTNGWAVYPTPRFSFDDNLESLAVFFNNVTLEIDKFKIDGSFYPGWPSIQDSGHFNRSPILVDIDHDSKNEVVSVSYGMLYLVDDDGSIISPFPLAYGHLPLPNVADFDGDGEYELIFYDFPEILYCIDLNGNIEPGWPVELPEDIYGAMSVGGAVGDLDLDGTLEYVLVGDYNIYAYRYDGTMQPGFPIASYDTTYYQNFWGDSPVLGDVDLDGYLEILTSAGIMRDDGTLDSYIAVYEHTGEMKENWPLMFPGEITRNNPIVADINNDDVPEIGFSITGYDGDYFVDVNGNPLPGWPATLMWSQSDIIVVDIDGDGDCEIFTDYNVLYPDSMGHDSTWYYGHSYLHAYDHFGEELPGYPIIVNGHYFCRPPSFGYDEKNHRIYMGLFTSLNFYVDTGYVEVYIFPDSTGPPDQWPMLGHDNLMTRNYNFVDNVTSIKDENKIIPGNYILKQNYPNPFNNSTVIEFSLPDEEHVNLSVYDILGRKVDKLVDNKLTAGQHRITWCNKDVSSGIYFYVLKTEKAKIIRMMTILK